MGDHWDRSILSAMAVQSNPPALHHIRVGDCMRKGIVSCDRSTTLAEIAEMLARYRVHAIVVTDEGRDLRVVSDQEIVSAISGDEMLTAAGIAATEPVTIASNASLHRAAQLMTDHAVSHLLVVDAAGGYPVGMLSTLDVAGAYTSMASAAEPDGSRTGGPRKEGSA
jgi:predicted transcriptional regulator